MPLGINPYAWNPRADVLALRSSSCRSQRKVKSPKVIQHKRLREDGSAIDADGCRWVTLGDAGLKTRVETPEPAIPDQAASSRACLPGHSAHSSSGSGNVTSGTESPSTLLSRR